MAWHEKVLIGLLVVIAVVGGAMWLLDQVNKGMD
jgi:heme/copper-type cytochrome/quinol oxidase subunit 4